MGKGMGMEMDGHGGEWRAWMQLVGVEEVLA